MKTANIPRHPSTPGYLEFGAPAPTFDESACFEAMSHAELREAYTRLDREKQQLERQVETLRLQHYQTQAALAGGEVAGEIKHGPNGVRVALTATGMSLPHGTLLIAVPKEERP